MGVKNQVEKRALDLLMCHSWPQNQGGFLLKPHVNSQLPVVFSGLLIGIQRRQ